MQDSVKIIAQQLDQEKALQVAFEIITKKYQSYRVLTFLRLDCLLRHDVNWLWEKRGFLHCHHMNYLLRLLLVKSGWFTNEVVQTCWTQIWLFSPHQYLKVSLDDGRTLEVDPWGRDYGILFGSHAHGLQGGTIFRSIKV